MIFDLMGGYQYDLFEREPEAIEDLLRNEDFNGINVTIPYKKEVLQYLDEIDPLAKRLGAVNTIVKRYGRLTGYNSDYYGFLSLVRRTRIEPQNKKVLVLGSGGASVTVTAVLEDLGARVIVVSRSGENNYRNLHLHRDASVIVNTTPLGMYPNNGLSPLDVSLFPELEGVLDLIYNPARTQLLLDCEKYGIPGWNGLWMLVAQAKKSAEWFMNTQLPDSLISDIHFKLRDRMENITLIGMAGCGKSSIGCLLAKETGKQFVDADAEVEKLAGMSIPEVFAAHGEEEFRLLETEVLSALGKQSGLVIATGGGARSKRWMQMKADVLNVPFVSLKTLDAGTVGSAMMTGVATGLFKDLEDAANTMVHRLETYRPREEMHEQYEALYERYEKVYEAVRPLV